MDECLLCRIVKGDVEAEVVDERPTAIAIRDINPQAPVHVLVMPRDHIPSVNELGPEHCDLLADIFGLIADIVVSEGIAQTGYRVVINTGEEAGQEIDHLHFHLMGGRFMGWPPG